jgi:hypothetical protein
MSVGLRPIEDRLQDLLERHPTNVVSEETVYRISWPAHGQDVVKEDRVPTEIDRSEVQRLVREQQGQLVEVLPPAEYEDEHLPGAINIPLTTLDRETARLLDRARPVIVYCYDYQ